MTVQTENTSLPGLTGGNLLARNTLLNLVGQAAPLLVAVVAIPFIVRGQEIKKI